MTGKQFAQLAKMIFVDPETGYWQSKAAKALGVDYATLRRLTHRPHVSKRDEFALKWLIHENETGVKT